MKKFFNAIAILIAFHSINLTSDEVEELIVTASLVDNSEINNPLYIINGEDIINGPTTSLGEAIDSYLGISIADYGAAVGQPIIRGMSGPRVKILKNGMVNRDVSGLGADHLNDVDLNNISQIEIVKGPSSLLYANGASGGIINIVDERISAINYELPKLTLGYESQSVNDGNTKDLNYKTNLNGFNLNFGYKDVDFGNYDIPTGAILHEEEEEDEEEGHEELSYIENSDLVSESTKFGISKVGDWGYFGASIDNIESIYGIPFHGEEHEEPEGEPHEEERIFSTTDSESFTLKGSYNLSGKLVSSIEYMYRNSDYSLVEAHEEEHDESEPHDPDEEEHEPTVFNNEGTEYGAILNLSNENLIQKISFNVVDEEASIIGEEAFMNPSNNKEFTVGYFISKKLKPINIDFGYRLDQIERSGSVFHEDEGEMDFFKIDESVGSFALSIGRDINDALSLNVGYSNFERVPSVIELFMNGPHLATGRFEVGDPNLKNETSKNLDVTFNFEYNEYFGFASFYRNDANNYIALIDDHHDDEDDSEESHHGCHEEDEDVAGSTNPEPHPHPELICANYVQEDAEFNGYEIEVGRTISMGSGDLTISFGRDVVNAEFSDGHNVPRINPSRNIYSLIYEQDDLYLSLNLKDTDNQNDVAEGETSTKGYQMLDARLTKTVYINDKELVLSLFANNLLDEVARNHSSFVKNEVPLPGKNFGIKFRFNL